jgi:hypothetical protein
MQLRSYLVAYGPVSGIEGIEKRRNRDVCGKEENAKIEMEERGNLNLQRRGKQEFLCAIPKTI